MLSYFDAPIGWGELIKRTIRETQEDDGLSLAAQLAYYFFLALFPAILFLIALASFFPLDNVVDRLVGNLQGVAPPDVLRIVRDQMQRLSEGSHGGVLTFGVVAALWSSSTAMVAIVGSLNRAYDVEESRPWWKQRVIAILLTVGAAVFILASFALVVAGPQLAEYIAAQVGLGAAFEWTWKILQWPVVFGLVATAIGLIYYFAPNVEQDWAWLTPGSIVATLLWVIGSLGFRFYVVNFGSYNETYGAIGGIMVLLLWLYLSGLVIVIGAEMNAEIEHASPHAKPAGARAPGERITVGARAAREFRERQQREGGARPTPRAPGAPARSPHAGGAVLSRAGILMLGAVAALFRRVRQ